MVKILANDGIHPDGKLLLEEANYQVEESKIPQAELTAQIGDYDVLIVRSATKVTKEVIDAGKKLKIIARGGVGLDNVDVEYAKSKGITVFNTPKASSRAVAELAIAHAYALSRNLHSSNCEMPGGDFKSLKKKYEAGVQLRGKTFGIVGFGRIGQEVAKIAIGMGMKVLAHDPYVSEAEIGLTFVGFDDFTFNIKVQTVSLDKLLRESDYITFHIPGGNLIGVDELNKMKKGVYLINTARGGVINEKALIDALNSGKVAGAGMDVFDNEPTPMPELINHPNVSCTPHIGAATHEAQAYIGLELADKIIEFFGD